MVASGRCWPVGAVGLGAIGINRQRVVSDGKPFFLGDVMLALFNFGVVKLFNLPAIEAHQMVMVLAFVDLIHRLAGLEVAAIEQPGLLKLHQDPVHRGQTDV